MADLQNVLCKTQAAINNLAVFMGAKKSSVPPPPPGQSPYTPLVQEVMAKPTKVPGR